MRSHLLSHCLPKHIFIGLIISILSSQRRANDSDARKHTLLREGYGNGIEQTFIDCFCAMLQSRFVFLFLLDWRDLYLTTVED